ncbi:hypothetical protein F4803DRAFT_570743 [Xylaria telfairii]|nr:hypothetical protein F4803DRAFT_570743 [Xylaria telfairii]
MNMEEYSETCSGCLDVGSYRSKAAIAVKMVTDDGKLGYPPVQFHRVPFQGSIDDPERAPGNDPEQCTKVTEEALYEFIACAALVGNKLVVGRAALAENTVLIIKSMILLCSGIDRTVTFEELPAGTLLLDLLKRGRITFPMMETAIRTHLSLLWSMLAKKAKALKRKIDKLVFTYPNYLCPSEENDDFGKYLSCFKGFLHQVIPSGILLFPCSEGQAFGYYVIQPSSDPLGSYAQDDFWDDLKQLITESNGSRSILVVVGDGGGSSFNCQVIKVYFDHRGRVIGQESVSSPDLSIGARGGSHLANFEVRKMIVESNICEELGELAAYINDFERKKYQLDWPNAKDDFIIHGKKGHSTKLDPLFLNRAFDKTFGPGLRSLKDAALWVMGCEENFAVLLGGGSYFSKGLQQKIKSVMQDISIEAQSRGLLTDYKFLASYDTICSLAVAAGGAMTVEVNLPRVVDILDGAAIGIQIEWGTPNSKKWVGEDIAPFLFSKGCGRSRPALIDNSAPDDALLRFKLVCDPNYYPKRNRDGAPKLSEFDGHTLGEGDLSHPLEPDVLADVRESSTKFKPLSIVPPPAKINTPMSTHEIGFCVYGRDLPPGPLHFAIGGQDAQNLRSDINFQGPPGFHVQTLELTCKSVNDKRNYKQVKHPLDKKWILTLTSDPPTKTLVVDEEKELPACVQNVKMSSSALIALAV